MRLAAFDLRRQGYSYREIAKRVGYADDSGARKAVNSTLARLTKEVNESAEEMRAIETERLDQILTSIWPKALNGELLVIDRCLRIMDRRAKMWGLDTPARVEMSGPDGAPIEISARQADGVRQLLANEASREHLIKAITALGENASQPAIDVGEATIIEPDES
jgi:hypothetical protein